MDILGYLAFIRIFSMFNMAAFQKNLHDFAQIVLT